MSRPEHQAPPEIYYNDREASKYTCNSRMIEIQMEIAERALELLALPAGGYSYGIKCEEDNAESMSTDSADTDEATGTDKRECESRMEKTSYLLLDLGVGSGLCAGVLEEHGHSWVGLDISESMLGVAQARQREHHLGGGDLLLSDMGEGIPFRPGAFDGAVSISALQWLCHADRSSHSPRSRLARLFTTLYTVLRHGSRAVFQFYPENSAQIDMILETSLKVGFTGGLVIDYPHSSKRKKYYLCLIAGSNDGPLANGRMGGDSFGDELSRETYHQQAGASVWMQERKNLCEFRGKKKKANVKGRNWVLRKKKLMRKRGYENIPEDSKFTARKRRPRF